MEHRRARMHQGHNDQGVCGERVPAIDGPREVSSSRQLGQAPDAEHAVSAKKRVRETQRDPCCHESVQRMVDQLGKRIQQAPVLRLARGVAQAPVDPHGDDQCQNESEEDVGGPDAEALRPAREESFELPYQPERQDRYGRDPVKAYCNPAIRPVAVNLAGHLSILRRRAGRGSTHTLVVGPTMRGQ